MLAKNSWLVHSHSAMADPSSTGTDNEMAALGVLFGRFKDRLTFEGAQTGQDLKARPTDVFISTACKCGTTWMQQICHQLRSGGDMDYEEINDVCPFLEASSDLGVDPDQEQKYSPRIFKTHFWEPFTPKGGRYIVVVRHPYDSAVSFFKFVENWMFSEGEISIGTFLREVFLRMGEPKSILEFPSNFHHYVSWWPRRHEKDVLWVFYEDLRDDLEGQVKRVASFLGITDPDRIAKTVEMSTFQFMKSHEGKFDENHFKRQRNPICGVPAEAGKNNTKVRVGGGQRGLIPDDIKALLDAEWAKTCEPVFGAPDYDEWRRKCHAEQASNSH